MAPQTVVPEGKTFFTAMKRSFVDVPIDESKQNAIATTEFLEAAESFKALFGELVSLAVVLPHPGWTLRDCVCCSWRMICLDLLDSGPFSMVEKDMRGNITVRLDSSGGRCWETWMVDARENRRFEIANSRRRWSRRRCRTWCATSSRSSKRRRLRACCG
jgi:hypothetical protein